MVVNQCYNSSQVGKCWLKNYKKKYNKCKNRALYDASKRTYRAITHDITVATKAKLTTALVWHVAVYGYEIWTIRTGNERIQAIEMWGLRQMLHVSWTAKRTIDWVLDKAGVSRNLLESVKARKLMYFGHITRKKSERMEKQTMQGTTLRSHTMQTKNMNGQWHTTHGFWRQKSRRDSSFIVWPCLSLRMAEKEHSGTSSKT